MGSCISKCKPKKNRPIVCSCNTTVHDKPVMSQSQPHTTPPPLQPHRISPPSPSPTKSSSSSSAPTSTTTSRYYTDSCSSTLSSSSSSSSTSSSALSPKDRTFSNDFLLSCIKENPHILRISSIKANALSALSHDEILSGKSVTPPRQSPVPMEVIGSSTSLKRSRASSPALTRQKSFRIEPDLRNRTPRSPSPSRRFGGETDRLNHAYMSPGRTLRPPSPSPSRRFAGDKNKYMHKVNTFNPPNSSCKIKEQARPASPSSNPTTVREFFMSKENFTHQMAPKVQEIADEVLSRNDHLSSIEDVDSPLISLDCFIFL